MLSLLVTLLLILIICGILYWVVTLLPLPQPFKQVATVIVLLIALLLVLNMFGIFGAPWRVGGLR
jgi:hypothetical protein